jgi:hypothetical protein
MYNNINRELQPDDIYVIQSLYGSWISRKHPEAIVSSSVAANLPDIPPTKRAVR